MCPGYAVVDDCGVIYRRRVKLFLWADGVKYIGRICKEVKTGQFIWWSNKIGFSRIHSA